MDYEINPRGRQNTERKLRQLFDSGDPEAQERASSALIAWRSKRGLVVADEWLAANPGVQTFSNTLWRYVMDGWQTFGRFKGLITNGTLSDEKLDDTLDKFSDLLQFRDRKPQYREGLKLLASFLNHPSPEVRWTVIFSLAKLRATEYRDEISRLVEDRTPTQYYGYVSGVARNALRFFCGDEQVDLWHAKEP
ncbi:MAG: HEAT repeat domain-containing protein [Fimbriimonadaceae bacterium]|nr:HEAT repeat domain-containing protein [Fimbriimonadaceae bacterium]